MNVSETRVEFSDNRIDCITEATLGLCTRNWPPRPYYPCLCRQRPVDMDKEDAFDRLSVCNSRCNDPTRCHAADDLRVQCRHGIERVRPGTAAAMFHAWRH